MTFLLKSFKIELIKNKWHVLSIDKENNEKLIREQLSNEEQDKFEFYQSLFGSMILPKCKLIVANFSLPFTKVEFFKETWNKIESSLLDEGYFVGNFFGKKDSWISDEKRKLVFLEESEVKNLFDKTYATAFFPRVTGELRYDPDNGRSFYTGFKYTF